MTFMEMINLLDDKHKARRECWEHTHIEFYDNTYYCNTSAYHWGRSDILATDWIVKEM